jgi:DNA-binding CsgD family transcriptional regulator
VSPNTVKTHVARLFEKLGAKRRTEAIRRARELGIVP